MSDPDIIHEDDDRENQKKANDWGEKRPEDQLQAKPNGGHKYGVHAGYDTYYWADAIRYDKYGCMEWYCVYPDHNRLGRKLENGAILLDYNPDETLEQFIANSKSKTSMKHKTGYDEV